MMYQDHLRTCGYCRNDLEAKKLAELGHMIMALPVMSPIRTRTLGIIKAELSL